MGEAKLLLFIDMIVYPKQSTDNLIKSIII